MATSSARGRRPFDRYTDRTKVLAAIALLLCHQDGLEVHEDGSTVTEDELEEARDTVQAFVFKTARQ